MNNPDFLIIGAGVVGLSTAWELRRAGARVAIVERGFAGCESSWAGGGMLFPLSPWRYAEAVTALTELARVVYPEWIAELQAASNVDAEYRQSGLLVLPPADFDKARAWCAARDLAANVVSGSDISPALAGHDEALWLPQAAQVRNPRLIRALLAALRKQGVVLYEQSEVKELVFAKDKITHVATSKDEMAAKAVIVCAGAWSQRLLGDQAAGADIFPIAGQMLLYKSDPGTLPAMVMRGDRYLIPRDDGHVLAGSTQELTGFEKATTVSAAEDLHASAITMLPLLSTLQPIAQWTGLRPGSRDNIPLIGRHPRIDNLYINSGHFRYGLTMAPAAARLLANSIAGRPQPLDA
ncbi:MAG: glycine oxidase ThiO, partial [Burkholderiales bacterium]|nr:glycine oxidase ThiO [Burkholderiales bacterium]